MKKLHACIAALLLSTYCLADDSKDDLTVLGVGTISCGKYLAAWDKGNNDAKIAALTWTQGFMTSINIDLMMKKQKP